MSVIKLVPRKNSKTYLHTSFIPANEVVIRLLKLPIIFIKNTNI